MGLKLVRLEGVGRPDPLGRERMPCSVVILSVGDRCCERAHRLAITTGPETGDFTRRSVPHC